MLPLETLHRAPWWWPIVGETSKTK